MSLKEKYPAGTRVELISFCNYEANYYSGLQGTVLSVDDAGGIHVAWDNGGSLALLPHEGDKFIVIQNV